jgi:hypothetical protein
MPNEVWFPIGGVLVGLAYFGRTWWTFTRRAATAERFGILTRYLWLALSWFAAASVTLVVMFVSDFDPGPMGWANIGGLGLVFAAQYFEKSVSKFGESWCIRHRLPSPDYAEDTRGNPVAGHHPE